MNILLNFDFIANLQPMLIFVILLKFIIQAFCNSLHAEIIQAFCNSLHAEIVC